MTLGERYIKNAIAALEKAITRGDLVEEALDANSTHGASWRVTSAEIGKCLAHLKSKPVSRTCKGDLGRTHQTQGQGEV